MSYITYVITMIIIGIANGFTVSIITGTTAMEPTWWVLCTMLNFAAAYFIVTRSKPTRRV